MDFFDYEAFWFHKEKKRPIKGLMGLGNSDCSKIFATGFEGQTQFLIFQKLGSDRVYKTASSEYTSLITQWMTCESSITDQHFYIGGMYGDVPTIGAISFSEGLAPIHFMRCTKVKSKTLSKIKRIEGSDILVVGMIQDLIVVRFLNGSEFSTLHSFNTFSEYEIIAVAFHTQFIFTLTMGDHLLQVLEFKNQLNQLEYYNTEKKEPLKVDFQDIKLGGQRKQAAQPELVLVQDKDIVTFLNNEDIGYNVVGPSQQVFEEEDKLLARLKHAKQYKRKPIKSSPGSRSAQLPPLREHLREERLRAHRQRRRHLPRRAHGPGLRKDHREHLRAQHLRRRQPHGHPRAVHQQHEDHEQRRALPHLQRPRRLGAQK
jgi:hypothetical protein